MIRTLDANYLSTFHLPRPVSGPAPFHLVRPPGLGLRFLLGIGSGLRDYDRRRRRNANPRRGFFRIVRYYELGLINRWKTVNPCRPKKFIRPQIFHLYAYIFLLEAVAFWNIEPKLIFP